MAGISSGVQLSLGRPGRDCHSLASKSACLLPELKTMPNLPFSQLLFGGPDNRNGVIRWNPRVGNDGNWSSPLN